MVRKPIPVDDYDGGGNYETPVPGSVVAVVGGLYDVGYQDSEKYGIKPKVVIAYELEERDSKGRRFVVFAPYTRSVHEKSALRPVLDACRPDFAQLPKDDRKTFDLTSLEGSSVMLTVKVTSKGRARATGVAPLPAQLKPGLEREGDYAEPFGLAAWFLDQSIPADKAHALMAKRQAEAAKASKEGAGEIPF